MHRMASLDWQKAAAPKADYFGFHRVPGGWVYREYAPNADAVCLAGEFNGWDWESHPLFHLGQGRWVLFIPGEKSLWNGCRMKSRVDDKTYDLVCQIL